MKLRRLLPPTLLAVAVALAGLAGSGCGDDDATATGETPTYAEILEGMKQAAVTDGTFSAALKARDLPVPEQAVIRAFCETAWQLEINSEAERLDTDPYLIGRIRNLAESDLGGKFEQEVGAAMAELQEDLELAAIDSDLNHRYKKACYLKPSQAKEAEQADAGAAGQVGA